MSSASNAKTSNRPKSSVASKQETPDKLQNVPIGIDGSTFFTPLIPREVKETINLMHVGISPEKLSSTVIKILRNILTTDNSFKNDKKFIEFQTSLDLQSLEEKFGVIYTGLYEILHVALKRKIKQSAFTSHLRLMNTPEDAVIPLSKVYSQLLQDAKSKYSIVDANLIPLNTCKWLPKLANLKWRIDITISSGSLSRVMRPNILFQMILCDGRIKTFEVSIEQFNQIRYGIAKLLFDMQTLDRHPILKIVNEFKIREDEDILK